MLMEAILAVLSVFLLWQMVKKPTNYPPGPWGLPLIGYLPRISNVEKRLTELNNKYGDIVSWRIGSKLFVFIFDYKLAKEALYGFNFVDRPGVKVLSLLNAGQKLGISSSNGHHWHNTRRFTLHHLRDLGMGKSRLVSVVQKEAEALISEIKKQEGKPGPVPYEIVPAVLNVVWQMVACKRFKFNDPEIIMFDKMMKDFQANIPFMMIYDIFPVVKFLPHFISKNITRMYVQEKLFEKMKKFLQAYVDEHKENLDRKNPKNYIDDYLIEMEKQMSNSDSTMSEKDLVHCISDLFGGGAETTSVTIHWAIYYLASFPKVQERLQDEIDQVLPQDTLATLEDKKRLPYTEAFISEVLRFSNLAAFSGIHCPSRDTEISGYMIPKGSMLMIPIATMHFFNKFYDSPEEFRPERFLDSAGTFVTMKEGFLPFGMGRRQCLGESLARMKLFIFLTTLVKYLNFETPPGKKIDLTPIDNPFLHFPKTDQEVLITLRTK